MAKYIRVFAMGLSQFLSWEKLKNKSVYMLKVKMLLCINRVFCVLINFSMSAINKYYKVSIPVKTRHSSE